MPLAVGTIACATFRELKPAVRAQNVRARKSSSNELLQLQVDAPTTCFASRNTEEASSAMGQVSFSVLKYNQIIRIKVGETFFRFFLN
jgi:hypothetical protein